MSKNRDRQSSAGQIPSACSKNTDGSPMERLVKADVEEKLVKAGIILKQNRIKTFSYLLEEDILILYDDEFNAEREFPDYLQYLNKDSVIHPEDRWKVAEFYQGRMRGPIEVRILAEEGGTATKLFCAELVDDKTFGKKVLLGSVRDIAPERERNQNLEMQARRDSLTMLYNRHFGKELIDEYLTNKNPYASCGMMVMDIDYFKSINDIYGHLFGDEVLMKMAKLLTMIFDKKDILMRAGGDEFVVFLKDISHSMLVKKAMQLVKSSQRLTFSQSGFSITCSIGVCFLGENISGYTYEQLFANADWAMYRAKEKGRNRYEFCDSLQRFEQSEKSRRETGEQLDARYLRNDVIATAFEIFEKMNSFNAAMDLLLKVIGTRFDLDRITVIRTDVGGCRAGRQYQWISEGTEEALSQPGSFSKEDFLTLFHSYDEYGTVVLQKDDMSMYSEDARKLLMQGGAKTVVYAAMYCEGKYTGAISYVVCGQKRYWSKQSRSQLGEITKIISAHLAKNQALNASDQSFLSAPGYDPLTGLISFSRFREEVERRIIGGEAKGCMLIYTDFENFTYFNQKCGYSVGDQILKEFSNYVIERLQNEESVYFTRVISDQFILYCYSIPGADLVKEVDRANEEFIRKQEIVYQEAGLRLRSGIYQIGGDCMSASAAIDAANFARKQVSAHGLSACLYDEVLGKKQILETEIVNDLTKALQEKQFKLYLQPRYRLRDKQVIGAEALIRWEREDGRILFPDEFIPVYERNGRIVELDFYVFEQVAAFLAKNRSQNRRQVPVAVNISILHATENNTADRYMDILRRYKVDPSLLEIELTETATVSDYSNVKRMFKAMQKAGMKTVLDDFGAGYSVLNTVIDIPVNTVKLDKAFINNCESSERGLFFLKQIISMVKGLGYEVVCEGVETERQEEILLNAGCENGQGYWFSRPLPLEEYEKFVYWENG